MAAVKAQAVKEAMAKFLRLDISKLDDSRALLDLVSESFILVEMVIDLQEDFGIRLGQKDLDGVQSVGQFVQLIVSRT